MVAADQVSGTRRAFNVKDYIDEVLLSLRPKLKKTSHRIEVLCDEHLVIESYPGAFSQILTNFIINSLVHGFDADQAGQIRIEVARTNDTLELRYTDNGKGTGPGNPGQDFRAVFHHGPESGVNRPGLAYRIQYCHPDPGRHHHLRECARAGVPIFILSCPYKV